MKPEDVEKIYFDKPAHGIMSLRIAVLGLPKHLQADICNGSFGYSYTLRRNGDFAKYEQNPPSTTAEQALAALKRLLNWEPN